MAAFLLDVLAAFDGRLADAAGFLGISTANFASALKADTHLYTAAQQIRKRHGLKPLT